jgi:hypothetical protein
MRIRHARSLASATSPTLNAVDTLEHQSNHALALSVLVQCRVSDASAGCFPGASTCLAFALVNGRQR